MTTATTDPDLLRKYSDKATEFEQRADALEAQQAQLRRDGHRDRAERLQVSIDSMRAAASEMAGRAIALRMGNGVPTGGEW